MSVAKHLGIRLAEYDHRIRTFIPFYREMLDAVASAVRVSQGDSPDITDLGIGTGALSARCLRVAPGAAITGIDSDPDILEAARARLRGKATALTLLRGAFERVRLPRSDALVATLALHHIRTARAKTRFYRACRTALRPTGVLLSGDVFLADDPALARQQHGVWLAHLRRSYSTRVARDFLSAWAAEDRYFTISAELRMLSRARFRAEVLWRRAPFGILIAWPR